MVENLKKTFIFKNSILLTLFIIFVANLNNLINFDFNFDKKNELIIFVLLLLIYTIVVVGISLYYLVEFIIIYLTDFSLVPTPAAPASATKKIIDFIQGGDSIDKDMLETKYVYEIFLAVIFTLFIAYSVLIFKYDTTFTKTQSFILFIFTTSLLFLFCRNIVIIILNLLTKSRTTNLIFSIKLFFILNLVYFITYFHFYNKQKKDKETRKKNSIQ
tara:strand:+ start:147 stop:794 length:648 start_codon:yes stop_codon:yes gene_type:complete